MAEYVTVKYKLSTIKWLQRGRLFLFIPGLLIVAIILLIESYASVFGALFGVMACYFIWNYIYWQKLLKETIG